MDWRLGIIESRRVSDRCVTGCLVRFPNPAILILEYLSNESLRRRLMRKLVLALPIRCLPDVRLVAVLRRIVLRDDIRVGCRRVPCLGWGFPGKISIIDVVELVALHCAPEPLFVMRIDEIYR